VGQIRKIHSEDDADVLKHVGVLTLYKILLIYTYIYIYVVHFLVWIVAVQDGRYIHKNKKLYNMIL